MFKKILKIFYVIRPTQRLYFTMGALVLLYVFGFLWEIMLPLTNGLLWFVLILSFSDGFMLLRHKKPVLAKRETKYKRLSNGDINEVTLLVQNWYPFPVYIQVIDELPYQFQIRNFNIQSFIKAGKQKKFNYELKPVERGEYHFGTINIFIKTKFSLIERHLKIDEPFMMACYPSFIRLRQFELMAINNRLSDLGIKRIRKIGSSTEFEQIKEYVSGDDVRKINWKATARKNQLMVNHYVDEKAQHVYSIIDMGRVMKMPFNKLKLLDYAINASLVISHIAWIKQDKPGVIGFNQNIRFKVKADNKGNQLVSIQEALYNADTGFLESSYEMLFAHIKRTITQRSLLLLYTNFESLNALKRQLKYLRKLAQNHLLVVIFFENTELNELLNMKPSNTFDIYRQTIAQKFDYEKRMINIELRKYGILSLYTTPQNLSVNVLNKYLEIKTRNIL